MSTTIDMIDRQDLQQVVKDVNTPPGYVGTKIFPLVPIRLKVGSISFQTLVADSAAQTGRALGVAPTATTISENTANVTCAEIIKRYNIDFSTVEMKGGIENCDKIGARASVRSVQNALETLQLAELITAAGTDITGAIISGLITAAKSVKRYAGKLVFVCTVSQYQWLIQQDEIKELFRSFCCFPAEEAPAWLSIRPDIFRNALQSIFLFDDVLIADENFWPSTYLTTAAVVKIADGLEEESYSYQPEYGRTFVYLPQNRETPYQIDTHYDSNLKANVYDALVWADVHQLNAGAKSLVLIDAA